MVPVAGDGSVTGPGSSVHTSAPVTRQATVTRSPRAASAGVTVNEVMVGGSPPGPTGASLVTLTVVVAVAPATVSSIGMSTPFGMVLTRMLARTNRAVPPAPTPVAGGSGTA
jgi:hypothetical protein